MLTEDKPTKSWRYWWHSSLALIVLIWAIAASFTTSFTTCRNEHDDENKRATEAGEPQQVTLTPFVFLQCQGVTIEENDALILALFTGVLAVSTIGLWLQTKRLAEGETARSAETQKSLEIATQTAAATNRLANSMEISARAAEDAAKATKASLAFAYRPIMNATRFRLTAFDVGQTGVAIRMRNRGPASAFLVQYNLSLVVTQGGLPVDPHYDSSRTCDGGDLEITSSQLTSYGIVANTPNKEEMFDVLGNTRTIFAFGFIKYRDASNNTWETGFIRRLDPEARSFVRVTTPTTSMRISAAPACRQR